MPWRNLPDARQKGPPMTVTIFNDGEPVIITSGQHHGRRGTILGIVKTGDVALINVDVAGLGQILFRSSVLMRDRQK